VNKISIIFLVIFLILCDCGLTYLQKYLLEKKGCWYPKIESNLVIRWIMKSTVLGYDFSIFVTLAYQMGLLWFLIWMIRVTNARPIYTVNLYLMGLSLMLIMVVYYHFANLLFIKKQWNKKEVWVLRRKLVKLY